MAITIKHGSRDTTDTLKEDTVSLTWQGLLTELHAYGDTLIEGNYYSGLGTLTTKTYTQDAGPLWNLRLDYSTGWTDSGAKDTGEVSAPSTQALSARVLSKPIETHPNYRTKWNHYLVALPDWANTVPTWWDTATDTYLDPTADGKWYRWVKSLSEVPLPDSNNSQVWTVVKSASASSTVICQPTKPGVDSYDFAYYVITETGKHKSKASAGWVTNNLMNTVVTRPILGDFGLTPTGYNWKVDDIQVQYDGKRWVANRTYTRSGDANGWDSEIYGAAVEPSGSSYSA